MVCGCLGKLNATRSWNIELFFFLPCLFFFTLSFFQGLHIARLFLIWQCKVAAIAATELQRQGGLSIVKYPGKAVLYEMIGIGHGRKGSIGRDSLCTKFATTGLYIKT